MANELEDLTKAAKMRLEAQKKSNDSEVGTDIYADFREEDNVPSIPQAPQIELGDVDNSEMIENPIDDNDAQIYEDGPYLSQVQLWKKQYGAGRVLHTQILEKHFVFRTLNRFEYKKLVALENVDALMREEVICSTCVLHPRNYNFKSMAAQEGGYPSTLAQIILESSGFTKEYGIEIL